MTNNATYRGWLCVSKNKGNATRAGDNFNEWIGETYVWPKTIPHAHDIAVNDVIALWDSHRLLGFSFVESIDETIEVREQYRCPNLDCRRLDIRERVNKVPRYKCGKCKLETESPIIEVSEAAFFSASYAAGWVEVSNEFDADSCRAITTNPNSQHSIRELDLSAFEMLIGNLPSLTLRPFRRRGELDSGGHKLATVRVRIGQEKFRKKLRYAFGDVCAVTGPNHQVALEASHLYSYANLGEHHEDGGLLLRRDIHRLFDNGLIAVNPSDWSVDVHQDLLDFADYAELQGRPLAVTISTGVKTWLRKHWTQYRVE